MRILIVRTSALGDVVHALPVLDSLRRSLPQARLGWVVEEGFAPLLAGHPALDAVVPVALKRWRRAPFAASTRREVAACRRRLRAFAPDVALDLMGNYKGAALARLSGAPRRRGAAPADRRERGSGLWTNDPAPLRGEHAVDRGLSLLAGLAEATPGDLGASGLRRAMTSWPAAGEMPSAPYVLIQPGAGWGNKRYPPERWGEVARRLAGAGAPPVRVLAGPGEEDLAAAVVAAAAEATAWHPGGLQGLARAVAGAALVLGGDTGPVHLARALGTPVLALFGPTDPRRHGPYGAADRVLFRELPCSFCHRRFATAKACLLELHPRAVADRALAVLGAARNDGIREPEGPR